LDEFVLTIESSVYLPGLSAFVPQEDRLHGFFTVKSYMRHYARLSGMKMPQQELESTIDELISQLGLTEQKNTIVGDLFLKGLSGGQKRRLSIALEALSCPANFFLDEPTSGLDAESALQVMEFLKGYARSAAGRRVVLTIHQPSAFIWERIDNVVLLSKGKVMYEGSRTNIEDFFASNGHPTPPLWNSSDHYVTMVNDEFRDHVKSVDEWAGLYQKWENNHHLGADDASVAFRVEISKVERTKSMMAVTEKTENHSQRAGFFHASVELTYRYFLNLWFNPGILFTRVAMYSMLGKNLNCLHPLGLKLVISHFCSAFFSPHGWRFVLGSRREKRL
jgi:ABC-type multidrug transport system ATPase subunit